MYDTLIGKWFQLFILNRQNSERGPDMFQRTVDFLRDTQIFYIATVDGDQPRVRPFGVVIDLDGKLYFTTGNKKPVYRQLKVNPKCEISATNSKMEWIRLSGKAVFDSNLEAKKKAFELLPSLADIYGSPEGPELEVFYLEDAEVTFRSMDGSPPETGKI